jgi:hypothetical protein
MRAKDFQRAKSQAVPGLFQYGMDLQKRGADRSNRLGHEQDDISQHEHGQGLIQPWQVVGAKEDQRQSNHNPR